jgi:hypothetical protein
MTASSDPLLSVSDVARLWGTGIGTVIELIEGRGLAALDDGELIRAGHIDVPVIRLSWAQSLKLDSHASERLLAPEGGQIAHPAFFAAADFHSALDQKDADAVYASSSRKTRCSRTPPEVLASWLEVTSGGFPTTSGIGSSIYSLAPLSAVAAQVCADAPKVPRALGAHAPLTLLAILPLVSEDDAWRVDLPLFEGPAYLPEVLSSPLPDDESSAMDSVED